MSNIENARPPESVAIVIRTDSEIAELCRQWLNDGCWDLETTEGFEAHYHELHAFRLKHELSAARSELTRYRHLFREIAELLPERAA